MKKINYALNALKKRGIIFLLDYIRESVWFDLCHGISTSSRVPKNDQTIDGSDNEKSDGLLYVASFTSVTRITVETAFDLLGLDAANRVQFIDLGCGKGKALCVYAKYFGDVSNATITGIEYDPVLADSARTNIDRLRFAKGKVKIVTDSAVNVRKHITSNVAIIYIYNSFQGETLDATLDTLKGLPHVLIYVDPAEGDKLPARGYNIVSERVGRYNADTWLVATSPDFINR